MIAMHPAVQALLDLFATSLVDVRFADVDGPSLARCAAEIEAVRDSPYGAFPEIVIVPVMFAVPMWSRSAFACAVVSIVLFVT
jgi:hypothetical protein